MREPGFVLFGGNVRGAQYAADVEFEIGRERWNRADTRVAVRVEKRRIAPVERHGTVHPPTPDGPLWYVQSNAEAFGVKAANLRACHLQSRVPFQQKLRSLPREENQRGAAGPIDRILVSVFQDPAAVAERRHCAYNESVGDGSVECSAQRGEPSAVQDDVVFDESDKVIAEFE